LSKTFIPERITMKSFPATVLVAAMAFGCTDLVDHPDARTSPTLETGQTAAARGEAPARPFRMSRSDFALDWAITRDHELLCGGDEIAGGAISGYANFTHLGRTELTITAAWDIGNQIDPADVRFVPTGPAGGPVAPVLGPDEYPYAFRFDPYTGQCAETVAATGRLLLTAASGDRLHARVVGGETHRLDFVLEGDGIETFAITRIEGGTGRFANATGAFITHTITRFDFATQRFVIDLAEVLPGGTIRY
jgi:hypothetical protein